MVLAADIRTQNQPQRENPDEKENPDTLLSILAAKKGNKKMPLLLTLRYHS